jgi:hypothetical protein
MATPQIAQTIENALECKAALDWVEEEHPVISWRLEQHDGLYLTWTVRHLRGRAHTARTLLDAINAARGAR